MTPAQIREKMESLKSFIIDAEISVRDGKMMDLTGLDKDVAVVCQKSISLPPDQARDLQPLMAELIGELERLSFALKDFRAGLKKS